MKTMRWLTGLMAVVAGLTTASAHADTIYKTDTTTLNTTADWADSKLPALEHLAQFDGVLSAANAANLSLGADLALGGLRFLALKGAVTLQAGNTLTLGALGVNLQGGYKNVTLNHDLLLSTDQNWNVQDGNLSVNGAIGETGGAAGITKTGTSTLTLGGANTYSGPTIIESGAFYLAGSAASSVNSDFTLNYGTAFRIESVAATPTPPRVVRGHGLTLSGCSFEVKPPGGLSVSNVFTGTLTIGPGYTSLLINPDAQHPTNAYRCHLVFDALAQQPGGVVMFRGSYLGDDPIANFAVPGNKGNLAFTTPPDLVGGDGAWGSQTISILPFATVGQWNHLNAEFFAAYDPAYGIRRMGTFASSIEDGTMTLKNVRLTTPLTTLTQDTTINALKLNDRYAPADTVVALEGPGKLTVNSGAILVYSNSTIGATSPGTLDFGAREGFIHFYDHAGANLAVNSRITGGKGLTKGTKGTLTLTGPVDLSEPIRFMNGTLNVGGRVNTGLEISRAATLNLQAGSVVTGDVTVSLSSSGVNAGGKVVGTLTQDAGSFMLQDSAVLEGDLLVKGGTVTATNAQITGTVVVGPENRWGEFRLADGAHVAGNITVETGYLTLGDGGQITGSVTNLGTVNYIGSGDHTLDAAFDGAGTLVSKSTTGVLTLRQAPGEHAIGRLDPDSGATLALEGDADTVTTVNYRLDSAGGTVSFNGGTWIVYAGADTHTANIRIEDGVLTTDALSQRWAIGCANNSTFEMTGGAFYVPNTVAWGLRMANQHGAWHSEGYNFTGTQSGGRIETWGGDGLDLGSMSPNKVTTYDLSDGELASYRNGVKIGSATNAGHTGHTMLTLRHQGRLIANSTVYGRNPGDLAQQIFSFQGGVLAVRAVNTSYLRPAYDGPHGTLVNQGGILAPGDLGAPGRTTIHSNYTASATASLAVDLGGTTPANDFTNTFGYHDHVEVIDSAELDGFLRVSLLDNYLPGASDTFTVLSCANALTFPSGGFANVTDNHLWSEDGCSRFDLSNPDGKSVRLGSHALNQWSGAAGGDWDATGAWSVTNPAAAQFGAYFGTALTANGTVSMDAARTLRGLTFDNAAASYTVAGAGLLTLASDGAIGMPRILAQQGSHTLAVALALQDALNVTVSDAAAILTLAGGISGNQALTQNGPGTLALSGANALGAIRVAQGTLKQIGGATLGTSLSVAAGANYNLSAQSLTLTAGLDVAAGGTFDFARYGAGTLWLTRGEAGGAIDTVPEFWAAVAAGRVTVKGAAANPADIFVTEEQVNEVWYVVVRTQSFGTVLRLF